RRARAENQTATLLGDLLEHDRQHQLANRENLHRNDAENHADGAALLKDVAAKAAEAGDGVRDVDLVVVLEFLLLPGRHDRECHCDRVFLHEAFQLHERSELAVDADDGVRANLDMKVRRPAFRCDLQEVIDMHEFTSGDLKRSILLPESRGSRANLENKDTIVHPAVSPYMRISIRAAIAALLFVSFPVFAQVTQLARGFVATAEQRVAPPRPGAVEADDQRLVGIVPASDGLTALSWRTCCAGISPLVQTLQYVFIYRAGRPDETTERQLTPTTEPSIVRSSVLRMVTWTSGGSLRISTLKPDGSLETPEGKVLTT